MGKNQIDAYGCQIQTLLEILEDIKNGTSDTPGMVQIYGSDINMESNTPDGNMINIYGLSKLDVLEFCLQIYSAQDPDQALGVALDAVSQYNGITRRGGTYTQTNIVVTADRSLTLNGQDTSTPFTVADATGNQFQLITSAAVTAGDNTLAFIAVDLGAIDVALNTITNIATPTLGITAVNNPAAPTTDGTDEETDSQLRLRRQATVAVPSQNTRAGLVGGLFTVDGVADAVMIENTDASPDGDGVPGHGIWVIVDGGADADIADMINRYRPPGCPMAGAEVVTVTQTDGSTLEIKFDRAVEEDLYIQFELTSKSGGAIDEDEIKDGLVEQMTFGIYDMADITTVTRIISTINPDVIVTNVGVSATGYSYADSVLPSDKKNKFVLDATNITIS